MSEINHEQLLQELMKRNKHNQAIITNYLKQFRKKLKKMIPFQRSQNITVLNFNRVPSKKQKRNLKDEPSKTAKQLSLQCSFRPEKENATVNSTIESKQDKHDKKMNYRVSKEVKLNCFFRRGRDIKRGQKSSSQNKTPLYLKNIIFQANYTLKGVRNSEHFRTFYRKHMLPANLPILFAERQSVNYSQSSVIHKFP